MNKESMIIVVLAATSAVMATMAVINRVFGIKFVVVEPEFLEKEWKWAMSKEDYKRLNKTNKMQSNKKVMLKKIAESLEIIKKYEGIVNDLIYTATKAKYESLKLIIETIGE